MTQIDVDPLSEFNKEYIFGIYPCLNNPKLSFYTNGIEIYAVNFLNIGCITATKCRRITDDIVVINDDYGVVIYDSVRFHETSINIIMLILKEREELLTHRPDIIFKYPYYISGRIIFEMELFDLEKNKITYLRNGDHYSLERLFPITVTISRQEIICSDYRVQSTTICYNMEINGNVYQVFTDSRVIDKKLGIQNATINIVIPDSRFNASYMITHVSTYIKNSLTFNLMSVITDADGRISDYALRCFRNLQNNVSKLLQAGGTIIAGLIVCNGNKIEHRAHFKSSKPLFILNNNPGYTIEEILPIII